MIEIDGAYGEGGGQVLRTSLTLAALTGQPLQIHRIRENRSKPGLRPQHLTAVQAIAAITQAEVQGAEIGSRALSFCPTDLRSGRYRFDISTAGALTLVLQTIFLPLSFGQRTSWITLSGGSHVPWSPLYDYLEMHWLPIMVGLGFRADLNLNQAGFNPTGGGEVKSKILPAGNLVPFTCVERGELMQLRGVSGVANLEASIATRQKHQALKRLYPFCKDSKIKTVLMPSPGKGTFILLKAKFSNASSACFTALGAPGKPAETVADEAVNQMIAFLETDGCLDHFLADQLLLPLSFVDGNSQFRTNRITQHLLTNAHVIKHFLPVDIMIEGEVGQPGLVTLKGAGIACLDNGN